MDRPVDEQKDGRADGMTGGWTNGWTGSTKNVKFMRKKYTQQNLLFCL